MRELPRDKVHLYSLDLLRGYAAFLVCLFHLSASGNLFGDTLVAKFSSYGGWDGVALFFIISGFVVPFSLRSGGYTIQSFWTFMAKRIIRIDPPYIASIIVAVVLWLQFHYSAEGPPLQLSPTATLLHLGYLIDIAKASGYEVGWYVTVYWTLAYEFQFYIAIALLYGFVSAGRLYSRMIIYLIFIVMKAAMLMSPLNGLPLFFKSGELFLLGILLFQRKANLIGIREFLLLSFPLVGIACLDSWRIAVYAPITAALILRYDIRTAITTFGGRISYSLYLYHDSVGGWARGAFITVLGFGSVQAVCAAFVVSIFVAAAMYLFVERPALAFSKSISYSRSALPLGHLIVNSRSD